MASAFTPQSVISDVNVEAPDFGMLAKAAMSVQNRYLEGFNKYKSTITSILNAQVSSDDNLKFRSDYFKKIDGYLNNLGGVDFSNPANVSIAGNLMEPLVKDPEFLTDMNNTMMQSAEMRKLDSVKMSTDEKVRAQYSPDMEAAMRYNVMDMRNTKRGDGSILKQSVQRYVPFANLNNVLNEAAKSQGLVMSRNTVTGQWIIKDSFGNNAVPSLTQWARQQLGNTYDEQLMVTAKVNVRRQMDSIMQGNPNLTKEQALQTIAKDQSAGIYKNYEDYKSSLEGGMVAIDKQIADIKSRMHNKIPKGSQEEQYISMLKSMKTQYQKELADSAANSAGKDQDLQTAYNQYIQNPEYALLPLYKDKMAKGWAQTYAETHADQDIKSNPYGEIDARFRNELKLKQMDHAHAEQMTRLKAKLDYESKLSLEMMKIGASGSTGTAPGMKVDDDPYATFVNRSVDLLKKAQTGYYDQDVLKVATSMDNLNSLMPYDKLRRHLEYFDQMHQVYGNKWAANAEYTEAAKAVMKLAKSINPNITKDEMNKLTPGGVRALIEYGVTQRYAGDETSTTYKNAITLLTGAQQANEEFSTIDRDFKKRFNTLAPQLRKKIDVKLLQSTGRLEIVGADEEERIAIYQGLFPGYKPGGEKIVSGVNFSAADEKKFNFGSIGDAIAAAEYVQDGAEKFNGDIKEGSKTAQAFRNRYQIGTSNLKDVFSADLNMYPVTINGKEYMQVLVPTKSNKSGESKAEGISSGAVSLFIPKEKAQSLWQEFNTMNTLYGPQLVPKYPGLIDAPEKIFGKRTPISWITNGLENGNEARFKDSYLTSYRLNDGYVAFAGFDSDAPMSVVIRTKDNQTFSEELKFQGAPITKGVYQQDPVRWSNVIDETIRRQLQNYKKAFDNNKQASINQHNSNYMQNPGNFVTVDDIPSA